jgi:four helix bundle protein
MDLVVDVYAIIKTLPQRELYALSSQMQRSVVSVPSNIAEGFGRNHTKEFIHFLQISLGSLYEIQTQIEICVRLKYITEQESFRCVAMCDEIAKMISSLVQKLKQKVG